MLTQSYHFSQANLIMEVLGVGIFDIVILCQPWQDTVGVFSDALLALCWLPASESGRRRMQVGDSTTLPHLQAQLLPGFSLLPNNHRENVCPSGSPWEGCELLHLASWRETWLCFPPGCQSHVSVAHAPKAFCAGRPDYFTCCFHGSC